MVYAKFKCDSCRLDQITHPDEVYPSVLVVQLETLSSSCVPIFVFPHVQFSRKPKFDSQYVAVKNRVEFRRDSIDDIVRDYDIVAQTWLRSSTRSIVAWVVRTLKCGVVLGMLRRGIE